MPKPGKSARGSSAKTGTLMPFSKKTPTAAGGGPPKITPKKHGSGLIGRAKAGD